MFFNYRKDYIFSIVNILTLLFFFFYSAIFLRHYYDGHHIGLLYSNALDLLNGKVPFKEIFIQYGFLTTLIHAFILKISLNKVFFLTLSGIFFYLLSIFFISKSLYNYTSKFSYAFLSTIIILLNHPIPWLPWPNYLSFFFISVSIFFISKKKKKFFNIGFFLSLAVLSRQDFLIGIIIGGFFLLLFNIIKKNKTFLKNVLNLVVGFIIPFIIFFLYLININVLDIWIKYLSIPNFYVEAYETTYTELISNFVIFFITESFFNFITTPQFFIISLILITNTILIILSLFNKIKVNNDLFFIILLSSFLSSVSLKIELFRLYSSIIIGLIPLIYFISKLKNHEFKKNIILMILLPSLFAFIFYPTGNNPLFSKIDFKNVKSSKIISELSLNKWPYPKINSMHEIHNLVNNCNVDYLENFTFDTMYSTIGNLDRIRLLPYEKSSGKNSKLSFYIDKLKNPNINFIEKINDEIELENIILIINDNNYSYDLGNINITNKYDLLELNESNIIGKPNILRVYYPSKCII